jgi:hypothetical protein
MPSNWEDEFKKILIDYVKKFTGKDISDYQIITTSVPIDDLQYFSLENLARLYAFSIMKEDYEQAEIVSVELKKRNCKIKINVDELKKTGIIDIIYQPKDVIAKISINMKVLKEGMMIDFENNDLI